MKQILKLYLLEMEVEGKSKATMNNIKSRLNPFCDYITEVNNLNRLTINTYILTLKNRMLPQSVNEHIKTIRKFIKYLYQEDYINKLIDIKQLNTIKNNTVNGLSEADVKRILNYTKAKKGYIATRNYTMICIFVDTGIRVSELTQLKYKDISDTIEVTCKNKTRTVPLSPKLQLVLMKYIKVRSKHIHCDSEYLFYSRSGRALNNDAIEKTLNRIGKELNIHLHPHAFRHYYIQSLLKKGLNLFYISRLVGHESIETTKVYLNDMNNNIILNEAKKYSNL